MSSQTTDLSLSGVHHVSFAVSDLNASIEWFTRCLGAQQVDRLGHHDADGKVFAVVMTLPGDGPTIQLRLDPAAARGTAGFDPVTFAVRDRADLDRWAEHLDAQDVAHSPVLTKRIGEAVELQSPDGVVLRLYTDLVGDLDTVEFTE
ncbi:MAG: VOC family protein [Jatrophihabitans sp.]